MAKINILVDFGQQFVPFDPLVHRCNDLRASRLNWFQPFMNLKLPSILLFCLVAMLELINAGVGDEPRIIERFEGVENSWTVRSSQHGIVIHEHQRSQKDKRSGNQSEFLHFKILQRTNASLVHALKKAQAINDYCPSVWIKSNKNSIKFSVRVVLPRTSNPVGEGPLKVLVDLDQSESTHRWEQLGCKPGDLVKQLNARLRSIQFQFNDLKIEMADAYCDLLVLSGFDRVRDEYRIWLDDIAHKGFLPARANQAGSYSIDSRVNASQQVQILDSRFRVNGKPFFLRAIEHNGESFEYLKQLGFNAVVLSRLPTLNELDLAQQYQVWIVCPPILYDQVSSRELLKSKNLEMIFSWDIGKHLTSNNLDFARALVEQVEQIKPHVNRPAFCHAHFPISEFARICDFQRLHQTVFGSSFSMDKFREYIRQSKSETGPFVVDIQTRLPASILAQSKLLSRSIGNGLLTRNQILQMTYEALFGGARGLIFQSNVNLQQDSSEAKWLTPIVRSINRELIQIDPWIAGGTAKQIDRKRDSAITFDLPRSQMTLTYRSRLNQIRTRNQNLEITTSQQAPRVYRIIETGVVPILHQSGVGSLKLELAPEPGWERFVVSEDTLSFEYIQQATKSFSSDGGILRDKHLVLRHSFERLKQLVDALQTEDINSPSLYLSIAELEKSLVMIQTFLAKEQFTTVQALVARAENRFGLIAVSLEQELLASRKFISSSFNSDFGQLANYIALEKMLRGKSWSHNLLAGGSFESLAALAKSGWAQHLNSSSRVQAAVRLTKNDQTSGANQGRKSLLIQTWKESDEEGAVTITPVWLESPKIDVKKGQVIRVDGYIKIDEKLRGSLDGFMILDTIGGPELGSRFDRTSGWQYFAIERLVPRDTEFGLILAHTGIGNVRLANLQIRLCDLELEKNKNVNTSNLLPIR